MPHPHPPEASPASPEPGTLVGWFMLGYDVDPDHEYSFELFADGRLVPHLSLTGPNAPDARLFAEMLADPGLHHVRFFQKRTPEDEAGRPVENDPYR